MVVRALRLGKRTSALLAQTTVGEENVLLDSAVIITVLWSPVRRETGGDRGIQVFL